MSFRRMWLSLPLILSVLTWNCFKEPLSPVMPTWDVTATFPLGTRVYTLADLIAKDTSLLKAGTSNQITFSKTASLPAARVGERVRLTPGDTSVQMKLGAFSIVSPDQRRVIDIPWLPKGQTVPVPDTTLRFEDVRSKLDAFEQITLRSGTITLRLDNNLPVAMEVLTPIRLTDPSGNTIATFVFSPSSIPPFSSRSASDDLASRSFTSDYVMTGLNFHTPGSATPVQIPTGDLFVATLSTSNLKARQAVLAEIPPQRIDNNDTANFRIDDSTLVKEVYLRSGSLRFSLQSRVPLAMTYSFRLSELERQVGGAYVPYEDSLDLPAYGTGSLTIDLTNARILSRDGDLLRRVSVRGSVGIASTIGQPVTVADTDKVFISVTTTSPLVADSAIGVVKPTWVDVDSKVGLNLWHGLRKFSGQINVPAAQLHLTTNSSIGFPADAHLKLGARRSSGDSVFINVPAAQRRLMPGQDGIEFDPVEVGRFLSQLSSQFPDSVRVYGRVLVNPPDVYVPSLAGVGSVGSRSGVSGSVSVSVPLNVGISGGTVRDTLVIGDTLNNGRKNFMIDQSTLNQYNGGKFYIEVENGLPAELAITVSFLGASRVHLMTLPQNGQSVRLAAARVDASGNVVAPTRSVTVLDLTRQEIANYNPSEYLAYSVGLSTSSGSSSVQFKTDNQVKVRVWTQLVGRIR